MNRYIVEYKDRLSGIWTRSAYFPGVFSDDEMVLIQITLDQENKQLSNNLNFANDLYRIRRIE